jgi:hypothetical protein
MGGLSTTALLTETVKRITLDGMGRCLMLQSLRDEYSYPSGERHVSVRYEFSAEIEIEWCSRKIWGRVRNVSRHGMFIELPDLPVVNAAFPARLALNKPLGMECVVRRLVPGRGIGVTVTIPGREERRRYEALLAALSLGSEPAAGNEELTAKDFAIGDGQR